MGFYSDLMGFYSDLMGCYQFPDAEKNDAGMFTYMGIIFEATCKYSSTSIWEGGNPG